MPTLVLRRTKLRFAQCPLQRREQMRQRLRVIPNVSATALAAATIVTTTFPPPQPAIGLTQYGRRLQNRQVRGNGFGDFGRQSGIVKTIAEPLRLFAEFIVMLAPEICHFAKVCKPSGIPWFVIIILPTLVASLAVWMAANAEICLADIPGKAQHDRFRCPWSQCERHKQTSSRRRFALSDRRILVAFSLLNIFPRHGQRVKPAASKPCMIHLHLRIIHRGGKSTFFPLTVFDPEVKVN